MVAVGAVTNRFPRSGDRLAVFGLAARNVRLHDALGPRKAGRRVRGAAATRNRRPLFLAEACARAVRRWQLHAQTNTPVREHVLDDRCSSPRAGRWPRSWRRAATVHAWIFGWSRNSSRSSVRGWPTRSRSKRRNTARRPSPATRYSTATLTRPPASTFLESGESSPPCRSKSACRRLFSICMRRPAGLWASWPASSRRNFAGRLGRSGESGHRGDGRASTQRTHTIDQYDADVAARRDDLDAPNGMPAYVRKLDGQHAPARLALRDGRGIVARECRPRWKARHHQQQRADEGAKAVHGRYRSLRVRYSGSSTGVTDTRSGSVLPGCSRVMVVYWYPLNS